MGNVKDVLFIVIPAYNEQDNIENVINGWYKVIEKYDAGGKSRLVIFNDGSKDNTYNVAISLKSKYKMLEVVDKKNSGHGATVLYGYQYAINHKANYVFQTDSDGQTNPSEFDKFWELREKYDLIIGNRCDRKDGISRLLVTRFLRFIIRLIFGVFILDANAPYRLMEAKILSENLKYIPKDFNLSNIVLSVIYFKKGFKVRFLDITFKKRQGGKNSINIFKIINIGLKAIFDFIKINKDLCNEN